MDTIDFYRNFATGEVSPSHRIGVTEDGRNLYQFIPGWEPCDEAGNPVPYQCDEDGNFIPGAAPTIEIRKNKHGWGGVFLLYTYQPYAAFVDGEPLVKSNGVIRTFGGREAARKAADKHVKSLATA